MESEIITRLKEFINQKGWSKAEFARQLEIFPQDVNRYLTGVNDVQKIFIKLHKVGCNIIWLIDGSVPNTTQSKPSNISNTLIMEKEKVINKLTMENVVLKAESRVKDDFIKMLLDRQEVNIKPNETKSKIGYTEYSNPPKTKSSVCAI